MKRLCIAAIAAIIIVLLILYVAKVGWLGLSLKNEVRPLEAITLVVNLLIAFFLQRFFTTRMNDLRAEKNVLIDTIKEIIHILGELRERTDAQLGKVSIDDEDRFAILSGLRRIANAITDLEESVSMSHLGSIKKSFTAIRTELFTLKSAATGGSFPSEGYSIQQINSQVLIFRSLKTRCQQLIFTINDAQR
jgi:hypothetical protein